MGLGTVVIDGFAYRIARLRLHDGMLLITAIHDGPVRPCENAMAAVFGDDGRGIFQSWNVTITEDQLERLPPPPFGTVTVELPVRIGTLETGQS